MRKITLLGTLLFGCMSMIIAQVTTNQNLSVDERNEIQLAEQNRSTAVPVAQLIEQIASFQRF